MVKITKILQGNIELNDFDDLEGQRPNKISFWKELFLNERIEEALLK